jgi:carboxyl-terminal processing protease
VAGRHLILVASLSSSFFCNTLLQALPGSRTATPPPTALPSRTQTATAEVGPQPSYIPPSCPNGALPTVAPEARALTTPTAEPNAAIDTAEQLRILDALVETVETVYVYPDYNGVDWPAMAAESRQRVEAGIGTEAFYHELEGLITSLGDDHSTFETPSEVAASTAELAGQNDFVGIGVLVEPLPEFGRVALLVVFPDSPAQHEGLRSHDSILEVDGAPIVVDGVAHPDWVRGPECTMVVLTVQSPGEEPRQVALVRARFQTSLPIEAKLVPTGDSRRIGYIFIPTFFDETVPGQVEQALHELAPLDGLIVDNRKNSGGSSSVIELILGFFTSGTVGEFVSREATRLFRINAQPVENSQTVPLVVLVGDGTVSFGEIVSGVLHDIGRAQLVGETTRGNVEVEHGYSFEDGSRVWIAEETFDPLRSNDNWERDGIVPDVEAYADWFTFTLETDPSVLAALELLPAP